MKRHPHNLNYLKQTRQDLRKNSTPQEQILWHMLRRKNFTYKFKRQHGIGNFIVDFYVKTLGLIVEIDGESHNDKEEYDKKREDYLESLGLKIFKTTNLRVLHDLDNVMKELELFVIEHYSTRND
jgi:very-short-patch-repair endonuclease